MELAFWKRVIARGPFLSQLWYLFIYNWEKIRTSKRYYNLFLRLTASSQCDDFILFLKLVHKQLPLKPHSEIRAVDTNTLEMQPNFFWLFFPNIRSLTDKRRLYEIVIKSISELESYSQPSRSHGWHFIHWGLVSRAEVSGPLPVLFRRGSEEWGQRSIRSIRSRAITSRGAKRLECSQRGRSVPCTTCQ